MDKTGPRCTSYTAPFIGLPDFLLRLGCSPSLAGGEAKLKLTCGAQTAYSLPYSGVVTEGDAMAGWERLSATVDVPEGAQNVEARLLVTAASGTAWFGAP